MKNIFRILFPILIAPMAVQAQLAVNNTSQTANALVQNVLLGGGVQVSNITFNGMPGNTVFEQLASFNSANANVGIPNGVFLASGGAQVALGPNNTGMASVPIMNSYSDPDLQILAGGSEIFDAAVLEFDFIPSGSQVSFNFVFGSEEYLEFVDQYNDVFGFFLSGPGISGPYSGGAANIALVPGTSTPVSINTVNSTVNAAYYVNNGDGSTAPYNSDPHYIQFDGFTTSITASATVQCGQQYHIKLAVGDAIDAVYDSGVFLQANAFASPTMDVTVSSDQELPCSGGSIDLSISSVSGGIPPYSYSWSLNGTVIGSDQSISVSVAGTYVATVIDGCGGSVQQQVIVSGPVSPPIDLQLSPDQVLPCTGTIDISVLSISGGTPPFTYEWSLNGSILTTTQSYTVPENSPGNYVLTVLDDCGGIIQGTVSVGAPQSPPMTLTLTSDTELDCVSSVMLEVLNIAGGTAPYTYTWTLNGATVGNGSTIDVAAANVGIYTVTVNDDCFGSQQGTIVVSVPPPAPLEITVTPDPFLPCQGLVDISVLSVIGGIAPYTFNWTMNGAAFGNDQTIQIANGGEGKYTVTVTDTCGAFGIATIHVAPPDVDPIEVNTEADMMVDCIGDQVTLSVLSVSGGDGEYSYFWTDAGANEVGTGPSMNVVVMESTTYTLLVTDNCLGSGSAQVNVIAPDPLSVQVPGTMIICENSQVVLQAAGIGGKPAYEYIWSTGDTTDAIVVAPLADSTFTVQVTDGCGHVVIEQVSVHVQVPEVTAFSSVIGGDKFEFTAECIPTASYEWSFSTGIGATGMPVQHTFADEENYWAIVIATTDAGCTDVDTLFLAPSSQLLFPNAFTPNGDGINDTFGPVGYKLDRLLLTIYDRWGAPVFTSTSPDQFWNGELANGSLAPTGVYVYQFRASGERLSENEGIGSVTLLGQDL